MSWGQSAPEIPLLVLVAPLPIIEQREAVKALKRTSTKFDRRRWPYHRLSPEARAAAYV